MENNLEINFNQKKEVWDDFLLTSPQRSIFSSTKFLDSLGADYQLATCSLKGKIVCGMPIIMDNNGKPITEVFPFTQYQGVLLADHSDMANHSRVHLELDILDYFLDGATKHFGELCSCNSWRINDMRSFQWLNYREREKGIFKIILRYSAVLDLDQLDNFDAYIASVRKVRRQEYNKARSKFSVEETTDENVLDRLHKLTFERQGIERDKVESELLKSITKKAVSEKYGRLTCVKVDNKPIAANLFIFDDRTGYYLFGANHPDFRNSFAGTLLLVEAINNTKLKGLKEVDFVGANSPARGDYKISFNPELKPYFIASFS